jgi:hypothetical protein
MALLIHFEQKNYHIDIQNINKRNTFELKKH